MDCSPTQLQKEKGLRFNLGAGNQHAIPVVLIGWIKLISRKESSLDKWRIRGETTYLIRRTSSFHFLLEERAERSLHGAEF